MAAITSQWGNSYSPQVKLTLTQTKSTETSATYEWKLEYIADYAASTSSARSYTVKIDGDKEKTGTYDINGKTGTKTIASGTKTLSRGTSAREISYSVSFSFNLTWNGTYAGTKTASSSFTLAKKTAYTVKYNANGGSGAPSSQTKSHDVGLTLSSTKPTRSGYTFQKWNTKSDGSGTNYSSGASYTDNASVTLYAVWKANTYTVSYNANGGSGAPSSQTKSHGVGLTLSSTKPTRSGYTFRGWATSSTGAVKYSAGGSYTSNSSVVLYAVWGQGYTKPKISSLTVSRNNTDGTASVVCKWSTYAESPTITIKWKLSSASSYPNTNIETINGSGTIGTTNKTVGITLEPSETYTFLVTVADSGGSASSSKTVSGSAPTLEGLAGGKGIAFGKNAELEGYADFAYKVRCRDNILTHNGFGLRGLTTSGNSRSMAYMSDSDNMVFGNGSYYYKEGIVYYYGHDVSIKANETITSNKTITVSSDRRLKENIVAFEEVVMFSNEDSDVYTKLFDKLQPVSFNYIDGNGKSCFGLIAQDVIASLNELGIDEKELDLINEVQLEEGGEKTYGIAYGNLHALQIHKIKKLEERIVELENIVEQLTTSKH